MPKFVTKVVEEIKGRERVEQLFIDGIGQLEKFENELQGTTYYGEYIGLLAFIQHIANGGNAGNKLVFLKDRKGPPEYEFRSKHLRIYATQQPGKKIIIHCGFKKKADSSDNIAVFRSLNNEYLNHLKKEDEKRKADKE